MEQEKLMDSIFDLIELINYSFNNIEKSLIFFEPTHQTLRKDISNEAAWQNNIDFYYGLFFERCDIWWDYILQKVMTYGRGYECLKEGKETLHYLRTYKSHTLDKNKTQNKRIIDNAEAWYYRVVGSKRYNESNVYMCSERCNTIVFNMLEEIYNCIDDIINDSKKERITVELLRIKDNYYPDFIVVQLFSKCVEKYELKNINVHQLGKKYGKEIREKAKLYGGLNAEGCDKIIELYIEEILFSENVGVCPLSGEKIMEIYNIRPGKLLGEIKRKAIDIAHENLYITEEELLKKLAETYPHS